MKTFEKIEIQTIEKSFEFRKKEPHSKHTNELNKISSKLSFPIKTLTKLQRAIISGCIKEYLIYPNQDILNKTEFEIFLLRREIEKKCIEIDIALKILNKLNVPKKILFQETFEKIDKLSNPKEIYYSRTNDGKIFKVGIITRQNEGMKVELCKASILENFKISTLYKNSFMKSLSPIEFLNYSKEYEKNNTISVNHKRVIELLNNVKTEQPL